MALLMNNKGSNQNAHFCKDSVISIDSKQLMLIKDSKTEHTAGSAQGSTAIWKVNLPIGQIWIYVWKSRSKKKKK